MKLKPQTETLNPKTPKTNNYKQKLKPRNLKTGN